MRPQLRDVRPAWSRNRRSNRRRKPRRRRLPLLPTPVPPKSLPKSRRGARPGRAKSLRAAFASRRTPTVRGSPHEPFIQPSFAQAAASGCDGPSRRSAWRASPIPRGRRDLFGTFGDAGSAAILPAGSLSSRPLFAASGRRRLPAMRDPGLFRRTAGRGAGGARRARRGLPALDLDVAAANLPFGREANLPHGRLQVWSFGQVNSTTDPFNSAGLSTPFMFVPWSTPLSGWTNAQTWNWWRERAGVQPPYW